MSFFFQYYRKILDMKNTKYATFYPIIRVIVEFGKHNANEAMNNIGNVQRNCTKGKCIPEHLVVLTRTCLVPLS